MNLYYEIHPVQFITALDGHLEMAPDINFESQCFEPFLAFE